MLVNLENMENQASEDTLKAKKMEDWANQSCFDEVHFCYVLPSERFVQVHSARWLCFLRDFINFDSQDDCI